MERIARRKNVKKTLPYLLFLVSLLLSACASPTSAPTPTVNQQEIENSVNATLTAMAPTEASHPTEAPQPTEAPSATQIPLPTPTPEPIEDDPAQLLGEPDGVDTFDTKSNWALFNNECYQSEIIDGVYVMTAKGQEGIICWEVSRPEMQDFYIDTMVFMPDECTANDRFGMLFRAPDDNRGYQYGLTCDGKYTLTLWDGEQTTVLVEPTANDVINVGLDAVNRLGVAAYGGSYLLYANGTPLKEVVDTTFTDTGMVGYFVRAATTSGFVVQYDDLRVWLLADQFIPPSAPAPPTTGTIPTPNPGVATVTTSTYVKVRSGPSKQYQVLFIAQPDTSAAAKGILSDGAWYAIEVPTTVLESGIGWVSADFVIPTSTEDLPVIPAPPPPPEFEPSPPAEGDPTVTTIDAVNIRSGPNNQCTSYGVPTIGTPALAIGISADGSWYAIRIATEFSADGIGWVNANYITTNNTENLPVMDSQICP
jgi:uncharacterized protein YraI